MIHHPFVSIACITYNQEKYIAKAIDSFLIQKTDFPFDIVIGEDCSTDNTRAIILDYAKRLPEKFKLLLPENNLGTMNNLVATFKACEGKYIAMCEGDDYWTDPLKLQKQVDFMEANPDFTICSHNVKVAYEDTDKPAKEWLGKRKKDIITLENLLSSGSGGATCSLVFRSSIINELPEWYIEQKGGDWSLQVLCASKGRMKYFSDIMGVYRINSGGSLSVRAEEAKKGNLNLIAHNYAIVKKLTEAINSHFNFKYQRSLRKMNIYWYLSFVRDSLKAGDVATARQYSRKIIKEVYLTRFWNAPIMYPRIIFIPIVLLTPGFVITSITKQIVKFGKI